MHDEATTHYIDMIDQTTLGHRFIKEEFGVTPRVGWQIDPFGHSAVQAYLLGQKTKRKTEKSLEVIWQGSKSLGSSAQIFAGAFPENYEPPSGFYFEVNDASPIVQDDITLFDYNVQERVEDFVAAALSQSSGAYVFRPNGTFAINPQKQGVTTVIRGPIIDEVHQVINPWIYQDEDNWMSSHVPTFSAIDSSYSLPDNVAILTLQELTNKEVLLRLAHLYEIGEDKELSVMSQVELKKLFQSKQIGKVVEMSLSGNQERSEMEKKRLAWKAEGWGGESKLTRGGAVDPGELLVELAPMEIRTFVIHFDDMFIQDVGGGSTMLKSCLCYPLVPLFKFQQKEEKEKRQRGGFIIPRIGLLCWIRRPEMRGLRKSSIRTPALLHLLCATAILSLFVFAINSSFSAGNILCSLLPFHHFTPLLAHNLPNSLFYLPGNQQITKTNKLDLGILSDFQSTLQQCVANRGLGLTAQIIDYCNLILKFPEGLIAPGLYNEQFKIFEPLEYKYDVCEAILLWEQYRNMTTVLTREYLDARPDGWLDYAAKRIAQFVELFFPCKFIPPYLLIVIEEQTNATKTLCEEHLNVLLPAKPPFHPRQFHTCAVVGNSGDLLKMEFGKEIDSHDAVIRDNEAPVNEKYAKYVGLKRDFRLVVRGAARNMIPILNGSAMSTKVDIQDLNLWVHYLLLSDILISSHPTMQQIPNPVYLFQGIVLRRGAKGTGMKSIELALSMCEIVDIYGFTVDPGYTEWTRYFSTPRKGHNPLQGRAYYQLLECLGVIRIHSPMRAARKQDWSDIPSRETISRAHSAAVRLKKSQAGQEGDQGQFRNCKVWGHSGPYGSGPVSGSPDMSDVRKNSNYSKWEVTPFEKLSKAAQDHFTQMEGVSLYKMDGNKLDDLVCVRHSLKSEV
ncbi:Sialyltransferase-like protein 1 [Sesamum angolense]|uniref:alpha-mannosidase n=1 Tax=Sesamum angolense TaxID=2727404 RepID=A0AAE2BPC1_9LAMI|nr:Sialyltransferase-like protein 1 [Sesamum angolense]